jgi:hypothetical protein
MKCNDFLLSGNILLLVGVVTYGVRQVSFKNDYSNIGLIISGLAVTSGVAGTMMLGLSTKPEYCETE